MVAVAVPDLELPRQLGEQRRSVLQVELRRAVLAPLGAPHLTAQSVRNPLHPVADAQYGHAQAEYRRVAHWRAGVIYRARPAREHHARWLEPADLLYRRCAGQDGGEHLLFAHSPGDQLGVLTSEIQHDNAAALAHLASLRPLNRATIRFSPRRYSPTCSGPRLFSRCAARR